MEYKLYCIDTINFEDGRYIELATNTTATEVPKINYLFSDMNNFVNIVPRSVQPGTEENSYVLSTNHYSYFPTSFRISLTSYIELVGIPAYIDTFVRHGWTAKYCAADGTEIEKFI